MHAEALAASSRFRAGMIRFAATRPVHGECGGYMVLGNILEDAQGTSHAMLGLLDHATSFARRRHQSKLAKGSDSRHQPVRVSR